VRTTWCCSHRGKAEGESSMCKRRGGDKEAGPLYSNLHSWKQPNLGQRHQSISPLSATALQPNFTTSFGKNKPQPNHYSYAGTSIWFLVETVLRLCVYWVIDVKFALNSFFFLFFCCCYFVFWAGSCSVS
jgi:hypothetical protein